jgi:undecaprenyl-diphosphatase
LLSFERITFLDYLEAILLGLIQGATEFLPVSSSGHLLLTQRLFNMDDTTFGLTFDVALHMGTLLALLFFFRNDLIALPRTLSASLAGRKPQNEPALVASGHPGLLPDEAVSTQDETPGEAGLFTARLIGLLITACIPAVIVGATLNDFIENNVREPLVVALMLAVFGIIMLIADKISPKNRLMAELTYPQAFLIGLAQALALVPGVSRAGITMTVGLLLGLKRDQAARFSFLMAIPIIAGAGAKQGLGLVKEHLTSTQLGLMAVGVVVAALAGYAALRFLIQFLNNFSLAAFAYYRVALAIVVALVFIFVR